MTAFERHDDQPPRRNRAPRWVTSVAIIVLLAGIAGVAAVITLPIRGAHADSPIVYTLPGEPDAADMAAA